MSARFTLNEGGEPSPQLLDFANQIEGLIAPHQNRKKNRKPEDQTRYEVTLLEFSRALGSGLIARRAR